MFWAAVWLAIALVAIKAYYLGIPPALALTDFGNYLRSLAAISYGDVFFAAISWAAARAMLAVSGDRIRTSSVISVVFVAFAAFAAIYAVASVIFFGIFGGFLTYPLLALVGSLRMLSSSVAASVTPRVVLALVGLPLTYALLVEATVRVVRPGNGAPRITFAPLGVWLILGIYGFSAAWTTRQDRRIAENPHWVLLSSWWQVVSGDATVRLTDEFPATDLSDFDPIGPRLPRRHPSFDRSREASAEPSPLRVRRMSSSSCSSRSQRGGPA